MVSGVCTLCVVLHVSCGAVLRLSFRGTADLFARVLVYSVSFAVLLLMTYSVRWSSAPVMLLLHGLSRSRAETLFTPPEHFC